MLYRGGRCGWGMKLPSSVRRVSFGEDKRLVTILKYYSQVTNVRKLAVGKNPVVLCTRPFLLLVGPRADLLPLQDNGHQSDLSKG